MEHTIAYIFLQAVKFHQDGKLEKAERLYQDVL